MFNTPTTYNPDTGVNLALANNANMTNKSIAETAAKAQLDAARMGASATKTAGVASGVGSILGGAAGAAAIVAL
jgi:ribosomal protein L4